VAEKHGEAGAVTPADMVFVGTFTHALDPKKRLTIPSSWRDRLKGSESLYVLPDVREKCLCVFPAQEMVRRLESIGHHSIADPKARQFARVLASRADLVSWDSQGRIRIKDELLAYASVQERAVLVGNFRFFEVWAPDALKDADAVEQADLADAVRYVGF
jgi:MraZ protein